MKGNSIICGIDEAGRGPLAGPVSAACVFIPENSKNLSFWQDVTDSKKLSAKKREALSLKIKQNSVYAIAFSDIETIDRINILQATLKAMRGSFLSIYSNNSQLDFKVLVDGNFTPKDLPCSAEAIIKGDSKVLEIGAASILAKVARDKIMHDLHEEFPEYGWNTNSGYGSKKHLEAINQYGVTPHHRRSFAPVRNALLQNAA